MVEARGVGGQGLLEGGGGQGGIVEGVQGVGGGRKGGLDRTNLLPALVL